MNARLNKRERRAAQLLKHYERCERLAKYLGVANPDGKRISVALFKIEHEAHNAATAQCNGEPYKGQPFREEKQWDDFKKSIRERVALALGKTHLHPPPGFFFNGDARGYALKLDNENPEGKKLIESVGLETDWGGYGILSPEITGE